MAEGTGLLHRRVDVDLFRFIRNYQFSKVVKPFRIITSSGCASSPTDGGYRSEVSHPRSLKWFSIVVSIFMSLLKILRPVSCS